VPELPEVEALAHHLREHALYRPVARVDVASMSAVKTFDPPMSALPGRVVTGAARYGKFLAVEFVDRPDEPLHLITHLSRAGWLRWHDTAAATPPKPGKGPLELRVHLDEVGGPGFDLTEAGTQKRLSVYLVSDPQQVPGIARLGPDALALSADEVAALYAALRSVLTDAVARSVGQGAAKLKGEKRSGLRVHARTGLPCPVCGDTVREVSFANRSFQYCPGCQTGGRPLADRRLSRLVR
jgi:formamidopyrimidine-DNA glycosylase